MLSGEYSVKAKINGDIPNTTSVFSPLQSMSIGAMEVFVLTDKRTLKNTGLFASSKKRIYNLLSTQKAGSGQA